MSTAVDDALTEIKVGLATMNGKIDTLAEKVDAGDKQSSQLVQLVKDQLSYLAADQGQLSAVVRENEVKANEAASAVRVDLERQIKDLRTDLNKAIEALTASVDELRQWRSKLIGFGIGIAALSSTATAFVMKAIGS